MFDWFIALALSCPGQAGSGTFNSSTSIRVKWRVRQCRRFRTFRGGLRKLTGMSVPCERLLQQLFNEWEAILRAKGFGISFRHWVLEWPFVQWFPLDFPTLEWTDNVLQLLEFDCQALAASEAAKCRAHARFVVQQDMQVHHSRQGFAALKGPARPPFSAVTTQVSQPLLSCVLLGPNRTLLRVHSPLQSRVGHPVVIGEVQADVLHVQAEGIQVSAPVASVPACVMVEQQIADCTALELHEGFFHFWAPFWNRDSVVEAHDLSEWTNFTRILERFPSPWPELPVDMMDLSVWRAILQKSSAKSATGACGFAVAELKQLPDPALLQFAMLCNKAVQHGLPQFMLVGRINVLAKTDSPDGYNDGRPICVLPATFRLWSSVFCSQLLRLWGPLMPPGIQGGLPGRSARDVTYHLQHAVEASAQDGSSLSGMVLDIIKCFNGLPRPPLQAILCHLGCPPALAQCWVSALNRVQRCASFNGSLSLPRGSTTGAPEGDPMSMAGIIAFCWVLHQMLTTFDVTPALYVDNFAWLCDVPEFNAIALQETLAFTDSLRLKVDWTKTFAWGRDVDSQAWWLQHSPKMVPSTATFRFLHSAKDLGTAMRYRGCRVLGCLKARMAEGHSRLKKLAKMPRPIANKARLIQSAVWPAVFYGAEGHALSIKHIGGLRTSAARALAGNGCQTNPYLAVNALAKGLQDPEMFLLTAMLRALQRALRHYSDVGESVLAMAVRACGSPYRVFGPASALKAMLVRNGWDLHSNGELRGPGNVRLSLYHSTNADTKAALATAWAHHVRAAVSHRNGLHNVDVPDLATTARVLATFTPAEQRTLARHITGGFQTAATKVLWHAVDTPAWSWCGGVESRRHRFVTCPAFAEVRQRHSQAVQALDSRFPHWVFCPFATVHDAVDVTTLVFASRPPPGMPHEVAEALRPQARAQLECYTDGTCANPTQPLARHAAWSLVLDSTCSLEDRELAASYWKATSQIPPCMQVQSRGLVPGKQTINRAELLAAIQAVRLGSLLDSTPVHVHTDSAYVVRVLSQFAAGMQAPLMDSSPNLDLLCLLNEVWFSGVTVSKLKSHRDPGQARSNHELLQILGNAQADVACSDALRADLSIVQEMIAEIAAAQDEQASLLRDVFLYLLDLHRVTNVKLNQPRDTPSTAPEDTMDPLVPPDAAPFLDGALEMWQQQRSATILPQPLECPDQGVFVHSTWGPDFAWQVWTWIQTIQWEDHPVQAATAVTTLELFCNYVVSTSSLPPLVIPGPYNKRLCLPYDAPESRLHPRTLRSWLQALTSSIRQLERQASARLLPGTASRRITSLQSLGDSQARSGFMIGCRFQNVAETAALLRKAITLRTTAPFWAYVQRHEASRLRAPRHLNELASSLSGHQKLARRQRR